MEVSFTYKGMKSSYGDTFEKKRRNALSNLLRAIERGLVDPDAIPLLSMINSLADYYSTSSCSGRIQLAATRLPGEKFQMLVIAKWHRPVSLRELQEVLDACHYADLWLTVQGPILHVVCRNLDAALRLIAAARAAGLKHSGIMWVGERAVAELMASDRIEAPLRLNGKYILREEALAVFIERVNEVLLRTKEKLTRLEATLVSLWGRNE